MKPIPGKISNKEFKNILRGRSKYVPKKVMASMRKSASLKRLIHKKDISRQEAMEAIKDLQKEGVISESKRPSQLYRIAGIAQRDFDEAEHDATVKKYARLAIQEELEDEASALDEGLDYLSHDRRGVLGKSVYRELTEEKEKRVKITKNQTDKKEKFDNKHSGPANKPKLVDLPDMDIG